MSTPIPLPPPVYYRCPGERHGISRAVHQARLSAGHGACQACVHRHDHGLVPLSRLQRQESPRSSALVSTEDGVRGRYLNEFTRQHAANWANALAVLLWKQRPLRGRMDRSDGERPASRPQSGPIVVVGFDHRPASPDLAVGVVTGLRRAGCQVVDVGQTLKPIWRFAAHRLAADAGILVTGAGSDASSIGLDFCGRSGTPLAWDGSPPDDAHPIARLQRQVERSEPRPTRTPGSLRTYQPVEDYATFTGHAFHALRPLKVLVLPANSLGALVLTRIAERLPCQVEVLSPLSGASGSDLAGASRSRFQQMLLAGGYDLGIIISDDGQTGMVWDEQGVVWPPRTLADWLIGTLSLEDPGRPILQWDGDLGAFTDAMQADRAIAGFDHAHRYWQGGEWLTCDAQLLLAAVLRGMSWSDAPLSQLLAEADTSTGSAVSSQV